MEIAQYFILLSIYIVTCVVIIWRYVRRDLGVFQAPLIFTLSSVLMMTPQFCTIILNPYYDASILWDLTFMMVSGTIAFAVGFHKAECARIQHTHDIRMKSSIGVFILMFVIGLYCTYVAESVAADFRADDGGDIRGNHTYQVFLFFRRYFDYGFFFALVYWMKMKKIPKRLLAIVITGGLYYVWVIVFFARRALTVKLFMSLSLLASQIWPKWKGKIKWAIVIFFSVGMVYNASIGEIRTNLSDSANAEKINYWENYKQSFYAPSLFHGMDLGNGAMLIKHVKEEGTYNYGFFLWNDIVTWYFPSFIFGKQGREDLKIAEYNEQYKLFLTDAVTTTTGYAGAFEAWGYLGFVLFYGLGYVFGYIWKRAKYSSLYLILYLSLMYNIPNLASHGFSYIIGNIETFIVFGLPLLLPFIYRKRIQESIPSTITPQN